jgi:ribonuclease Z
LDAWSQGGPAHLWPAGDERIVDALLTQVYDKDWQWRSMGEPSFGGWKPVEAKDIEAGAVVKGGRWKATATGSGTAMA